MKWNIVNRPLGMGCPLGVSPVKEIAWFVPMLVAAAVSAASQGAGAAASKRANDKARGRLNDEKAQTEAERRLNRNQAWTDTLEGQNTIRMLQNLGDREITRITGASKVGGATDAAVAAQKELLNQRQADVIADAAARHEQQADAKDSQYRQELKIGRAHV